MFLWTIFKRTRLYLKATLLPCPSLTVMKFRLTGCQHVFFTKVSGPRCWNTQPKKSPPQNGIQSAFPLRLTEVITRAAGRGNEMRKLKTRPHLPAPKDCAKKEMLYILYTIYLQLRRDKNQTALFSIHALLTVIATVNRDRTNSETKTDLLVVKHNLVSLHAKHIRKSSSKHHFNNLDVEAELFYIYYSKEGRRQSRNILHNCHAYPASPH